MKEYLIIYNGGNCSKPILAISQEEASINLKDQFEAFEGIDCHIFGGCEKEIVDGIRKFIPQYKDKSDAFIILYCDLIPRVQELISNSGVTIEQALSGL